MTARPFVRRILLERVRLDSLRFGLGYGNDAGGRPGFFSADWWTLRRQSEALASGHRVEVYVADHEVIGWRRA